ncbi:VWA domain-containing protein [Chitinivorax sp. B]|uniref:nitric oxide reductase activation protein NorD n=1 Tax=Chitinivorax sp. B TaxID=2502235 RepID=UPI0010F4AE9C|nr:VWA domain-containing protein [Chitinivorax sp. B]
MEEIVGGLWDRLIRKAAYRGFPEARVNLSDMARMAPIFFRALGGDAALTVASGTPEQHGARRNWLERIAGIGTHQEYAWTDGNTLFLPERIDVFPDLVLNRDLYLWLIALAAQTDVEPVMWFVHGQRATIATLSVWPGLQVRYQRLVAAYLAIRPDPVALPTDEARVEQAIRQALLVPGSVTVLPSSRRPPQPVTLWLHPAPVTAGGKRQAGSAIPEAPSSTPASQSGGVRKRKAEAVDMPDGKDGFMLLFRAESLFSWAEYVKVNRPLDEDEQADAAKAADDLDVMSVTRDARAGVSRVKFDLDLPSEQDDDLVLADGILLPEWHYRQQRLQPDHCQVQMMLSRDAVPCALPLHLKPTAQRLRRQFQALAPQRLRLKGQTSGDELDLDACVRFAADRTTGLLMTEPALYSAIRPHQRDVASLLLADLSLSTDAWVSDRQRVIDVIRDALFLFSEVLCALGDRYALYGFSSVRRHHVRCHLLKGFDERYDDRIRGRLAALRPGFYTRMGAAIRHASAILSKRPAAQRLLLVLTDGKPNDLDQYDSRYGLEDTRQAVQSARAMGLLPFCVTVDNEHQQYLPFLFGKNGYTVVSDVTQLPARLVNIYKNIVTIH